MNKKYYVTGKMVTDFTEEYMKKNRKTLVFPEALALMKKQGLLSDTPFPMPYMEPAMSRREFIDAYNRIPIEATRFIEQEKLKGAINETVIFPERMDIFCIRHERSIGPHFPYKSTYYTIAYVYEGRSDFLFEDKKIRLKAGDLCIVPPECAHTFIPLSGSFVFGIIVRSSTFNIAFNDVLTTNSPLSDFLRSSFVVGGNKNYAIIHTEKNDDNIRFLIQGLACECEEILPYSNACAISLFKLLLAQCCRRYETGIEFSNNEFKHSKPDSITITKYIAAHYKDASLKDAAEYFHYNEAYFSRLISSSFGKTFVQLVSELKVRHAKQLLEMTNSKISDISHMCGFDSKDHFSRTFKKFTGMSPSEYRKSYIKEK